MRPGATWSVLSQSQHGLGQVASEIKLGTLTTFTSSPQWTPFSPCFLSGLLCYPLASQKPAFGALT